MTFEDLKVSRADRESRPFVEEFGRCIRLKPVGALANLEFGVVLDSLPRGEDNKILSLKLMTTEDRAVYLGGLIGLIMKSAFEDGSDASPLFPENDESREFLRGCDYSTLELLVDGIPKVSVRDLEKNSDGLPPTSLPDNSQEILGEQTSFNSSVSCPETISSSGEVGTT